MAENETLRRYTIGKSCVLLDIDRVTLTRWMVVEGMEPQTDPRDKRYKYLTREQLLELARVHEKTIHEEPLPHVRLPGWAREMQKRIERLEEQVTTLDAAMEIVQAVANSDPETSLDHGLTVECEWCGARLNTGPHADDCVWVKARALIDTE